MYMLARKSEQLKERSSSLCSLVAVVKIVAMTKISLRYAFIILTLNKKKYHLMQDH
jgi:hypothetical protein